MSPSSIPRKRAYDPGLLKSPGTEPMSVDCQSTATLIGCFLARAVAVARTSLSPTVFAGDVNGRKTSWK